MQSYRSKGLFPGMLNILGTAHIHIDGARNEQLIIDIVKRLEKDGHLGKINIVYDFIAGKQREILPETYQSHTPVLEEKEALDFFSSNIVSDRNDAIKCINLINTMLEGITGTIIEMEQVVGWYDRNGWKILPHEKHITSIFDSEVDVSPSPSLDFEVHHGFDLPKVGKPDVSLPLLLKYCEEKGCEFGGWFVFEKPDAWGYRSNSFYGSSTNGESLIDVVEREQDIIMSYLAEENIICSPRTLIEKVIGIWHK